MFRYGLTILLSAFLLFLIQPLVAKKLLPELGGTATVWTTCLMFFQIALFVGYLYADLLCRWTTPKLGWIVHSIIVCLAAASLLVQPFHEAGMVTNELSWSVSSRLFFMIGVPFVVLAATSPLVQAWHSISHPSQHTYRIYALSNIGSLIALLSYPFVFDPLIGITLQSRIWNLAFCLFCAAIVASGWQVFRFDRWPVVDDLLKNQQSAKAVAVTDTVSPLFWIMLAANGSVLLIATSNILCQEVASFPFLWLLPLICYLLTMIICFEKPERYQRWFFQPIFAASCFLAIVVYHFGINIGLVGQSLGCCVVLFVGCMICHGELVRLRPDANRLTRFYLAVAFGGALGGFFAVVIAPRIFNRFFEFHISLLLVALFSIILFGVEYFNRRDIAARQLYVTLFSNGFAIVPIVCSLYYYQDPTLNQGLLFQGRNDYGLVSVKQTENYRMMRSGSTNHGGEFVAEELKSRPFAYYSVGSGAERAFSLARSQSTPANRPLVVGVIGLGTGSLLNYSQPSDQFQFYEVNPMVEQVAQQYFSYLPASNASVVLGDGRMELQRQLKENGSNRFDLLFLDAFSSDSIPVHLLTEECFDLYLQHLEPDGIIIAHITNRFVDLKPVLAAVARTHELGAVRIKHRNQEFDMVTDWILLSPSTKLYTDGSFSDDQLNWAREIGEVVWTDDHSSVFPIVNWTGSDSRPNLIRQK